MSSKKYNAMWHYQEFLFFVFFLRTPKHAALKVKYTSNAMPFRTFTLVQVLKGQLKEGSGLRLDLSFAWNLSGRCFQ